MITVGVVVPCHNDGDLLRRTLPALKTSLSDCDSTILVILDSCNDDSFDVVKSFGIEYVVKKRSTWANSISENRNMGFVKLRNRDYIAVVDSDTMISKDYFKECIAALRSSAQGTPSAAGVLTSSSRLYHAYQEALDRLGVRHKLRGTGRVYTGEAVRSCIARYGTVFRDVLGEDSELDTRIGSGLIVTRATMVDIRPFSTRKSIIGQLRSGRARRQLGVPLSKSIGELIRLRPFVILGYLLATD